MIQFIININCIWISGDQSYFLHRTIKKITWWPRRILNNEIFAKNILNIFNHIFL